MVAGGLLIVAALVVAGQCCNLPEFLTKRPYWESHIRMERQRTGLYIKFNENQMKITDYRTPQLAQTRRDCFSEVSPNKIIFSQVGADEVPRYMCIHFVQRSDFVVQIRESSLTSSVSDNLCNDENLTDFAWPLVWVDQEEKYESCPLPGGYDFQILDNQNGEDLCEDYWLKPRMESECLSGEGIQFDFRHYDCLGKLSMDLKQSLVCLGSWNEAGYTFSVLTDRDQLWPRIWLLRLPVTRGNTFRANLLTDIVISHGAEIDKNMRSYILAMTKSSYASLCENEAKNCGSCEKKNEFYCQKSCHKCDNLRELPSIPIDSDSQGQWTNYNSKGQYDVIVSGSELLVEGVLPFEAFNLGAEDWFEGLGRHTLTTISLNGCKPRYTCVELRQRSESVLQYRLSQSLVWPHTTNLHPEDICGNEQFRDDKPPLNNFFRSNNPKLLVRKVDSNIRRASMPTIIRGLFSVSFNFPDGRSCEGLLHSCGDIDKITLELRSCFVAVATYRCLSIFKPDEEEDDIYLVMENDHHHHDVQCWMLHKNPWSDKPRLYMTQATECFGDLPNLIQFENYTNYISTMDFVSPSPETGFVASCPPGGVPIATPEPTESRSTRWPPTPPTKGVPPPTPDTATGREPVQHPATSTRESTPDSSEATKSRTSTPEAMSRGSAPTSPLQTSTPDSSGSSRSSSEGHPVDPVPRSANEKHKPNKATKPVSETNLGKSANFVNDARLTQTGGGILPKSSASVKNCSIWLFIFSVFLSFHLFRFRSTS